MTLLIDFFIYYLDSNIAHMQPISQKKKFNADEYVSLNRANPIIKTYTGTQSNLVCICGQKNLQVGFQCFKCNSFVHICLAKQKNREKLYECAACLNKALDPLFQVRKVFVESYFKTQCIFEYQNIINFELILSKEDLQYPVQIRGIIPGKTALSWPMHGAFYINQQKNPFYELKPLLNNSNRKARREQYFNIPKDKLKMGKNYIKFKIPCFDKNKFTSKYQYEQKKIYYYAVNSVVRISASDLETQTFKLRRCEKDQSLSLLKQNNNDIQIVGNKVCLICPYTRERIKVPVRGRYCKHFSCICLETLIGTHASSRSWGCPICEEKMVQPFIDIWIFNMLRDNQSGSQVLVNGDGTYSWIQQENQILDIEQSSELHQDVIKKQSNNKQNLDSIKQPMITESIFPQILESKPAQDISIKSNSIPQVIQLDDLSDAAEPKLTQLQQKKQLIKKISLKIKNQSDAINKDKQQIDKYTSSKKNQLNTQKQLPLKQLKKPCQQKKTDLKEFLNSNPIIVDIKTLELKQMRNQQFKKSYFKSRVNPFKKYINTDELRKLFKDIL